MRLERYGKRSGRGYWSHRSHNRSHHEISFDAQLQWKRQILLQRLQEAIQTRQIIRQFLSEPDDS